MSLHIAVMLFDFSAVLGQFVDAPAVIVAGGRVVCSSILLLVSALLSKRKIRLTRRMDYGIAVIAGIILAIHWTTFFQSIPKFLRCHRDHYLFNFSVISYLFRADGFS